MNKNILLHNKNYKIIAKFYKNLINNEYNNVVNLRNIKNFEEAVSILEKYNYINNINELEYNDNILYISAKNLCNICVKKKCKFIKLYNNNDKISILLKTKWNSFKLVLDDKILLFKN